MIIFYYLIKYYKKTLLVQYLLSYKVIKLPYKFMEDNLAVSVKYHEKEKKLFSQSVLGYWITQSDLSAYLRLSSFILLFISNIISFMSVISGYHSQFFLSIHIFLILFAMIVYGVYLPISLFLTLKYAQALCSNSPFTVRACITWVGKVCVKAIGIGVFGLGIVPLDWTCEKIGVKPIFIWAYYPGLKRLAGDITPQLANQPSKDLAYVNPNIPGSKYIHYLQNKTDAAEVELALEYQLKKENKQE